AAINVEPNDGKLTVGVCVTELLERAKLLVTEDRKAVFEEVCSLAPGRPYIREVQASCDASVRLITIAGQEIIRYTPPELRDMAMLPNPATEPPSPKDTSSNDELYVTGLH